MVVKDIMTSEVVLCTAWDTARAVADLMKARDVGAVPVTWDKADPLLEGIVTDRDLCMGIVADAKDAKAIFVSELMTRVPVTCEPESTLEECQDLMAENKVRRIPVVDKRGRCVGIVTQKDIARHAPAARVLKTIMEISKPAKPNQEFPIGKDYFYCGQTHEQDQILLLSRRRELHREAGVFQ